MKIYVVGSSKNKFLPLDNIREKFLIDQPHEGDNIDFLNPWYCELTGLYYLWKHVDDELDNLNNEVCGITNGVGHISLMPLIDDEARVLFRNNLQIMDENYYLVFCYTNDKTNAPVRNKFAALSYAETYPVLIKPLKVNRAEKMISNQKELHEYLKELVNDESVLRSVRLAMRQGKKKKKDKICQ